MRYADYVVLLAKNGEVLTKMLITSRKMGQKIKEYKSSVLIVSIGPQIIINSAGTENINWAIQ